MKKTFLLNGINFALINILIIILVLISYNDYIVLLITINQNIKRAKLK